MTLLKKLLAAALALLVQLPLAPAAAAAQAFTASGGTAPLPALPAAIGRQPAVPGLDGSIGTPRAAAPQALPALEKLSTEAAPLAQAPAAQASAQLERHYSGAAAPASDSVVLAGAMSPAPSGLGQTSGGPSSLRPSVPSAPGGGGRRSGSQRGAVNVKVLLIIGGVVLVIGLVVGLVLHGVNKGNAQDKVWAASSAKEDVAAVERARRAGQGDELLSLGARARARAAQDKDEKLEAFDRLAALRAETNANAVVADPKKRVGEQTLAGWTDRLAASEKETRRADGSVIPLARDLAALRAELAREDKASEGYDKDLAAFNAQVPSLGGPLLNEQAGKGRADLGEFKKEVSAEQALYDQKHAVLKDAVVAQLARDNAAFREHVVSQARLGRIASGTLADLVKTSNLIDQDLADMAQQRHDEKDNRRLAEENRWVPQKDASGHEVIGPDGKPIMEDRSGPYTRKADQAAIDAVAAANRAAGRIESFNRDLTTLRRGEDVAGEGLSASLPASARDSNMGLGSYYDDLLDPDDLRRLAAKYTEKAANDARARFGTARGKIQGVEATVKTRLDAENKVVDDAVAAELKRLESGSW